MCLYFSMEVMAKALLWKLVYNAQYMVYRTAYFINVLADTKAKWAKWIKLRPNNRSKGLSLVLSHACVCTHLHIPVLTHTQARMYIHIYAHTYTYKHIRTFLYMLPTWNTSNSTVGVLREQFHGGCLARETPRWMSCESNSMVGVLRVKENLLGISVI